MLTHFNHLGQLTLFLVESGVVLLLLSELGSGLEECLEVLGVPSVLEEVDLRQQLLSFLLQLSDLFLELGRVHALITEGFCVLMNRLEFSLQVLIALHGVAHLVIDHVFVRDLERHQELCGVGFPAQIWEA